MALKEATHKDEVEELNEELKRVSEELAKKTREHDDLTKLSRDQVCTTPAIGLCNHANCFADSQYVY